MANMFDYLRWRGDLTFSQVPPDSVDALIFSTLVYIDFDTIVTDEPLRPILLSGAADLFFSLPDHENRVRDKRDLELLRAAAESKRFGRVGLSFYRNEFLPAEESQFAALVFLPDDGSAFLAYRGTDNTLVGWKEDFNMSFQQTVPAQHKAAQYLRRFADAFDGPLYLAGHSKGGNLAVFAGAKADAALQNRIQRVYNLDGPGFSDYLMGDPGYIRLVPKISTYIPQSSIIGMLLEHEEEYTVIKSSQLSIMQHEPYSWEVMAGSFVEAGEMSADTLFLDRTIRNYLAQSSPEDRGRFIDAVYDLLSAGGADRASQLIHPRNIRSVLKTLNSDENIRRILAGEFTRMIHSARGIQQPSGDGDGTQS